MFHYMNVDSAFDHIIGNARAKAYLKRIVERGTVASSLLFAGPEGVGKSLFAHAFARFVICQNDPHGRHSNKIDGGNHPDIRSFRPEGKVGMHSISSMRQLGVEVYLAPYEAARKVFIIHDAERMLTYSANALLKTFEEPAPDAIIILVTSSPTALLPTVLSRCQTIYFQTLTDDEVASFISQRFHKSADDSRKVAALAQGSLSCAVRLVQDGDSTLRKRVLGFLAGGGVATYKQLAEFTAEIAEQLEAKKKDIEEARLALLREAGEGFSAAQRQSVEKEIEGLTALHGSQEARALFDMVLGWYRDLQLIGANGNRSYLIHCDYAKQCEHAFERGNHLSIEAVQKAASEAQLALERSTSLHICLENFFLKLGIV
jgi:DNA polymerase III subunit delta'